MKSSVDVANEILDAESERRVRELRVLDAARAWRKERGGPITYRNALPDAVDLQLASAIDALDAPVGRYYARKWDHSVDRPAVGILPWSVFDGESGCVADCGDEAAAKRIAAALNVQERKGSFGC